ncbi:hypothetical protein U1Q18_044664 [Sarracenia purpurea var. burkii]
MFPRANYPWEMDNITDPDTCAQLVKLAGELADLSEIMPTNKFLAPLERGEVPPHPYHATCHIADCWVCVDKAAMRHSNGAAELLALSASLQDAHNTTVGRALHQIITDAQRANSSSGEDSSTTPKTPLMVRRLTPPMTASGAVSIARPHPRGLPGR